QPEQLTVGTNWDYAGSFSPDGKMLAFQRQVATGNWDIFTMALEGDRTPQPFLATADMEESPALSPDGRWIAYFSPASGRGEVYVRPFPGPGAAIKVSSGSGAAPSWNANGKELYYVADDGVWSVPVDTVAGFSAGAPQRLFKLESAECCGISSDGKTFYGVRFPPDTGEEHHLVYIPHFATELERLRNEKRD
ncbi:MAG TPA: hypothetical protein VIL97_06375, partial [Thermoanaerobaculia bacterium]